MSRKRKCIELVSRAGVESVHTPGPWAHPDCRGSACPELCAAALGDNVGVNKYLPSLGVSHKESGVFKARADFPSLCSLLFPLLISCHRQGRKVLGKEFYSFRPYWSFLLPWMAFPVGSDNQEFACNAGDRGSISGLGRFPGKGNGYSL